MGNSQYVSLQDAALLADKSPQTIRRLLKGNKLKYRKYKTPQGFTYLVEKMSLLDHFGDNPDDEGLDELADAELVEEFDPRIHKIVEAEVMSGAVSGRRTMSGQGPIRNYVPAGGSMESGVRAEDAREAPPSQQPAFRINQYREHAGGVAGEVLPPSGANGTGTSDEGAFQNVMTQLIQQHRDDKKRLFELLEMFQKRILTLEDQIKQLEAPKKKRRWFGF